MFEDYLTTLKTLSTDSFETFFNFSQHIFDEIGNSENFQERYSFVEDDNLASFPEDKDWLKNKYLKSALISTCVFSAEKSAQKRTRELALSVQKKKKIVPYVIF